MVLKVLIPDAGAFGRDEEGFCEFRSFEPALRIANPPECWATSEPVKPFLVSCSGEKGELTAADRRERRKVMQ